MFNIVHKPIHEERVRLGVPDAAKKLGVDRSYAYKLVKEGRIPSHKYLGKTCVFLEDCIIPPTKREGSVGRPIGAKDKKKRKVPKRKKKVGRKKKRKTTSKKTSKKKSSVA
jgi:excisionase family DNA binding protein